MHLVLLQDFLVVVWELNICNSETFGFFPPYLPPGYEPLEWEKKKGPNGPLKGTKLNLTQC